MKILKISVTDFGQKNLMTGDIDEMSGVSPVSAELGSEIHREIQDRRSTEMDDYRREVQIEGRLSTVDDVAIQLSGRIDGIWSNGEDLVIEEIKSSLNVRKLTAALQNDTEHPYILQAKIYGWLMWKQRGIIPRLQLLLVAAGSREEKLLPIEFDPESFSDWMEQRERFLAQVWREVLLFKEQRKRFAKTLQFPFARKRRGQVDLMRDVAEACKSKAQLLIQAPTGLGKTAGVMFPMLKAALRRSDKLFYLTPKNSQLNEAEKFLRAISAESGRPLGLIMTAKPKICMQDEVKCTPEACPFAKGHYDKVNEHQILQQLRGELIINADVLRRYASQYEVCPYELSRQMMPWVDVIAGDYHYALSPRASLREMAKLPLVQDPKPMIAIDEAHNLSERAIDWYSHKVVLIAEDILKDAPKKIKKLMNSVNQWLIETISGVNSGAVIRQLKRNELTELVNAWTGEMPLVLENSADNPDFQGIINEWFSWLAISELFQLPDELFFATKDSTGHALTVHCVNAGPLMRETLSKFHAVVAFSATLKPFSFHQTMNGFDESRVTTKEYLSPFPASHRRIIAIPQVSTAWRDRPKSLPRIVEVIERVIALRRGNYMAFFPSFELLRQALPLVKAEGFEVIEQPPSASAAWVQSTLKTLRRKRGILLMAVQGGVLSEGVDLPGDQLIGAFIIGPALSMVTPEREERRKLLGANGEDGFARAYGYPAMAKSIQSAGRVIRSSKDRGVIIMMDPRFLKQPYMDALPADWLDEDKSIANLISTSILSDIQQFWSNH